ncbi:hypothetical protein LTR27_008989 [Elasticomyces elasticus]|nr:hypothetical protein LTR27_008989 [Elasticomyces elasticus]
MSSALINSVIDLTADAPVNPRMAAQSAMPGLAEPITRQDWERKTTMSQEQQRSEVSQGLHHQKELEHTVALLRRQQARLTTIDPVLVDMIEKLKRSSKGLTTYFSVFLDPIIYNEMQPLDPLPSGSTPAAVKVFDLPELLEEVLGHVDTVDLLRFHQVNQSARTSINGSPRLRTALGLRAAPAGSRLRIPFNLPSALSPMTANFRFYKYEPRHNEPIELDIDPSPTGQRQVRLRAEFRVSQGKAAKIDERCRGMYITQPPVKDARVLLACCSVDVIRKQQVIRSDAGITIGMLWDVRSELLEKHKFCPHAAIDLHDADGFVAVEPSFTIDVQKKSGIPLLPAGQRGGSRRYTYYRKLPSEFMDRIKGYMAYKTEAFRNKQAIMTLKELDTAGRLDKYIADMRQRERLRQQAIVSMASHGGQAAVFNGAGSVISQHVQQHNASTAHPPFAIQSQVQAYVQQSTQMIQALQAAHAQQQQITTQGYQAVQPPTTQQNITQGNQTILPPAIQQHGPGHQQNIQGTASSAIAQMQAQYVHQQQMMAAAQQQPFTPFTNRPTLATLAQRQQQLASRSANLTGSDDDSNYDDSDLERFLDS